MTTTTMLLYKQQTPYFSTTKKEQQTSTNFAKTLTDEQKGKTDKEFETRDSSNERRSFDRKWAYFLSAPLIFFVVAFGGSFISIARQGFGYGKIPEQYQYFRRYIASNPTLMDELGVPLKIIGGTTKIEVKTENELKFRFEVQGEFGAATVFCERVIECIDQTELEENPEDTLTKRTVLHIHVDTKTDLGSNHFEIVNATSLS